MSVDDYLKTIDYANYPGLRFNKGEITSQMVNLYNKYDISFPSACGIGSNGTTVVKGLTEADLTSAGVLGGIKLFKLINANHELNQLAYNHKIGAYASDWKGWFPDVKMPTTSEYISKTPLLFMKDYFGRWAVAGEYDYLLPGGCGKPVVYLYPTKPTEVTVEFQSPMNLTNQAPIYHNNWRVLANPNGVLSDLQPQYTNCVSFETTQIGLDYALSACKNNAYPYLYWSGNVVQNPYPVALGGWVIESGNLRSFLDSKLASVGLNQTERSDMLSFWVPRMLKESAPFYRVSFFQTAQMNAFVPMLVTPKPDTVIRIFLDYQPLASKPSVPLKPQILTSVERTSFTMVEWGGLIRY